MRDELVTIGMAIKKARKERKMTIKQVADLAGVSIGLVSKIENYRTVPSLPVLISVAQSLNVNLSELVKGVRSEKGGSMLVTRKNEREMVEREDGLGFSYEKIISAHTAGVLFQTFVLRIETNSRREPVSTDGDEFLHILKGSVEFLVGEEKTTLEEGDSIFFDGRIPHVPRNTGPTEAVMLVAYLIRQTEN